MSGVVLNIITVVVGTAIGLAIGRLIHERFKTIVFAALGVSTFTIGASMALGGLAQMTDEKVSGPLMGNYGSLVFIGALVVGSLVGEALRIEYWLERLGIWLQEASYKMPFVSTPPKSETGEPGGKGHTLVEGFVTASLLFCVGAMTVLGSLQDGLGNHKLLYIKSLLDGVAATFLATTLGIGVALSAIPVGIIQGGLALGAHALKPFMNGAVVASIEGVGGVLIFAIGLDLMKVKRLPVGNMLPSILIAAVVSGVLSR